MTKNKKLPKSTKLASRAFNDLFKAYKVIVSHYKSCEIEDGQEN